MTTWTRNVNHRAAAWLRVLGVATAGVLALSPNMLQAGQIEQRMPAGLPKAEREMALVTWNLGYGGLGADSDFVADGGRSYFPPSRTSVRNNIRLLTDFLGEEPADGVLLQELARASPANLWHDLLASVETRLDRHASVFYADVRTRGLPPPFRAVHGLGFFSTRQIDESSVVPLPLEPGYLIPGLRRRYGLVANRIGIADSDDSWCVIVLHLAAFDEGAAVRKAQARAALAFAQSEYERGRYVVLGGDWNFVLTDTDFPHTTEERYLSWIHPFPEDILPGGWTLAADPRTPTVRTNERPFARGENFTAVIDGFVLSPNVELVAVEGVDLGFEASDHQPVRLRVRTR